jgi:catechol 2,3-dioxygenase-like lactoylglutathione lyase family enzyme
MNLLRSINALTLCVRDMPRSCAFYESLGLTTTFGGPNSAFTTFSASAPVTPSNNALHINLMHAPDFRTLPQPGAPGGWGRAVVFVDDVDQLHEQLSSAGIDAPEPRDAPWGERYFHCLDPDGHELSFATPDYDHPRWRGGSSESALEQAREELQEEKREQASSGQGEDASSLA